MKAGRKRKIHAGSVAYTDEPMELTVIENFLPPPDQLEFTEEKIRVTINLHQASIDFFKSEARRHRTQYQKIIRSVLDGYVRNATASAAKTVQTAKTAKVGLKKAGAKSPSRSGAAKVRAGRWKGAAS